LSSVDRKWIDITHRIVTSREPLSATTYNEAQEALRYWISQENVERCWNLLDRMAQQPQQQIQKQQQQQQQRPLSPYLIQPIVNLWRRQFKQAIDQNETNDNNNNNNDDRSIPQLLSVLALPSRVAQKLAHYEQAHLIVLNEKVHAMVLDAASHYTQDPKEGVYFADAYLKEWSSNYQRTSTSTTSSGGGGQTRISAPDIVAVGSVLHAWVHSGLPRAPQRAEEYLTQTLARLDYLRPNAFIYTSMISAWSGGKVGNNNNNNKNSNPAKAQEWLQRMLDNGIVPDLATWNTLLKTWANDTATTTKTTTTHRSNNNNNRNNNSVAEKAESILRKMTQLYETGELQDPPDVVSYSIVLDAWAKQAWGDPNAAQRAQALLDQMKHATPNNNGSNSNIHNSRPNHISYNTVITAHARAGNPQQAEALLHEMIQQSSSPLVQHNTNANNSNSTAVATTLVVRPDVQSFSQVIAAWSRVGTLEAAERAEALLRELMPRVGIRPNVQTYSNCLSCWAKVPLMALSSSSSSSSNDEDNTNIPTKRAQALFDELKEDPQLTPDVINYTTLMNVYGRHGQPEQAQAVMEDLLTAYERTKDPRLKPNVQSFTTVLSAWSHYSANANTTETTKKSNNNNNANNNGKQAPEHAEAWLRRMAEYGVQPNVISYSTVLDAWAKSPHPEAPDRAQAILDHMRTSKTNTTLRPNAISYTTVMKAYARHGRAEDAERLLQEMLEDDSLPQPDHYTFSSVLFAWSKSKSPNAAERAEWILVRMQELYEAKLLKQPPNVICYSNVLACWAQVPDGERAEAILRVMQARGVQPNVVSYNTVINAWANESRSNNQALDRVYAVLEELGELARTKKKLQPDEWTYRAVWKAIATSHRVGKLERANELLETMKVKMVKPTKSMMQQLRRWKNTGA
jgi:pentatricopeptide repeat protein